MKNSTTVHAFKRLVASFVEFASPDTASRLLANKFTTPSPTKLKKHQLEVMNRAGAVPLRLDYSRTFPAYFWPSNFDVSDNPTILLMHGWSGRAGQFATLVTALIADGYRVVALEGPAHGAAGGNRTGIAEFIKAIKVAERQFGPFHAVIGHSMGGAAALTAASEGIQTGRLVLLAAPENPETYLRLAARFLGFSPAIAKRAGALLETRFGRTFSGMRGHVHAPQIDIPVLVVHDRNDRQVQFANAECLAAALRRGTFVETKGLGHNRILEDGHTIEKIRGFLTDDPRAIFSTQTSEGAAIRS